jgi:thiamine biosynthesis lipoprotein
MSEIHIFKHHAMATEFQVRIAGEEKTYAAQTAQAAFALVDELESRLSRFRAESDIARIAQLAPGETLRLAEPVFACLQIAKKMEVATRGAFSVTASALLSQPSAATAGDWNLISVPSAKDLRSTEWQRFCASGVANHFCLSRAAAAFLRANRRRKLPAGRVGLATTIRRCATS